MLDLLFAALAVLSTRVQVEAGPAGVVEAENELLAGFIFGGYVFGGKRLEVVFAAPG